jgi:transposase
MTEHKFNSKDQVLVAVDVSKAKHDVLVEFSGGERKKFIVRNSRQDFEKFSNYLKDLKKECLIGIEATADYHRNFAYFIKTQGFELRLLSSIAVARTREALHNSWDKNDPKDAQVILHLMRTGVTQYYYDPLVEGTNDLQELSNTHFQISLRKTRLQHSILNHFLPLYFPEAERFLCASRAGWFARLLTHFPIPSSVVAHDKEEFISTAAKLLPSKHSKRSMLLEFYEQAKQSIGLPVPLDSKAVDMFRLM